MINIAIIGSGFIASVIAEAIQNTDGIQLNAITSRRLESAQNFAQKYNIANIFTNDDELINSDKVDAIYIATPTYVRDEITLKAAQKGKHILVDKPLMNAAALQKIIEVCNKNNTAFMDATHFSHHPRTIEIQQNLAQKIGTPELINCNFFYPMAESDNIRHNVEKEPTGCFGDMGWYAMRAIVEYAPNRGKLTKACAHFIRDKQTNAVIRAAGLVAFDSGFSATFDVGYNTGVTTQDLSIFGAKGVIQMNDFVLDWNNSFAFNNTNYPVGYTYRTGGANPQDFEYIKTKSNIPQAQLMLQNFAAIINKPNHSLQQSYSAKSLATQELLDRVWGSVNS